MKKTVSILFALMIVMLLAACSAPKKPSVFDKMSESSVAAMESADGTRVLVWNVGDISSFSSFLIEKAPMEPADKEDDWLYRITYNPKDIADNSEEIVVSFHPDYLQIGPDYYLPKQGVNYSDILEWAGSKFEFLVKEYGAEQ